jgi:DNA-binding transcriptional regulator YiaG
MTLPKSPSSEAIKRFRAQRKMTLVQAAELAGVTTRAWQFWEAGERTMQPATWYYLKQLQIGIDTAN